MGRVIVLGSINVDLETKLDSYPNPGEKVVGESLQRYAGGKGANQAVAARARGVDVEMVGAVGDDDAGRASLNRLFAKGIKLRVERIPRVPTGHALVFSDGRTNAIVVLPGANAKVETGALRPIRGFGEGDLLLTQLETPVEAVVDAVRYAQRYGARVVINLAPFAELPADVIKAADPLVIPAPDLAAFEALGVKPKSLVVLRGREGLDWDGEHIPGPVVPDHEVVDTVGATDALIGTLAAELVKGADRHAAAYAGLSAAASKCTPCGVSG